MHKFDWIESLFSRITLDLKAYTSNLKKEEQPRLFFFFWNGKRESFVISIPLVQTFSILCLLVKLQVNFPCRLLSWLVNCDHFLLTKVDNSYLCQAHLFYLYYYTARLSGFLALILLQFSYYWIFLTFVMDCHWPFVFQFSTLIKRKYF